MCIRDRCARATARDRATAESHPRAALTRIRAPKRLITWNSHVHERRNGASRGMHATGAYTSAETPNYMELTRIRAPKWLITRNRRPSPARFTNIPDFREKIQGFILIQRARVTHARALRHIMFALVTSSAAVRANAPAQFKRNVSARCVSSDARRDARSRDAGRRDDATRDFARWAPPVSYTHLTLPTILRV